MSTFTTQYEVHGSNTFDITMKTVTLHGHVIDAADSHPLNEANVQLQSPGQSFMGNRAAVTDSAGNFTFDNVPSGSYQITADKSGYGHDARTITISDSAPDDVQFQLSPGDGITIRAVDTRDNTALTVNVIRVVDSKGTEVPAQQGFFGNSSEVVKLALSPGVYTVTVMARNYAPQTISMASPSQQVVRFSPGGSIVLHSTDSTTRSARLIDSSGIPYGMNPISQGVFSLPLGTMTMNNVTAGHYRLEVIDKSSGRVTKTLEIDVVDGQPSNVNV